jgi:hypothetical protein
MFFQALTYFALILVAAWSIWKWVVKPILEAKGIEVEDDPEIITTQTKVLETLKKRYEEKSASAKAAREGLELAKEISILENEIKEADKKRKEFM